MSFEGGVNGSVQPCYIERNEVADSVNATFRRGVVGPRPGLKRVTPLWTGWEYLQSIFESGVFQHGSFYDGNGRPALISVHSGRIVKIDLDTMEVSELTPTRQGNTLISQGQFIIPAAGASAQLTVLSTAFMSASATAVTLLVSRPYSLATYHLLLDSVDDGTHITVTNEYPANAGIIINNPITTAPFTIPGIYGDGGVFNDVVVAVNDTRPLVAVAGGYPGLVGQIVNIGAYEFYLVSVDSGVQMTVRNLTETAGIVVNNPAIIPAEPVTVTEVDTNDPDTKIGWHVQAENYWIYQDNESLPIIFNGTSTRRSSIADKEVPVGNVMAYTMGRLVVALPDRVTFRAGDILFGPSGTAALNYKDALLKFTENEYLNEGGDFIARVFGAPSNSGPILSMGAATMTDTQLGQGPLVVGTPNSVFTVKLPFDRNEWKNLSYPLQTVNPLKGPLSQRSTVLVNSDLWYRSTDGIRSYMLAHRAFGTWGNTPQSTELGDLLSYDTEWLLENGSAVLFDNRLLMTVSPVDSEHGVYHRGLVALDFDLVSSIKKKLPPAWESIWTGVRPLQLVNGMVNNQERVFIYALGADDKVQIWEMEKGLKKDNVDQPILWSFETPSYNCGDSDFFKKLEHGRIIFDSISGPVIWTVKFRSDLSKCWVLWDSGEFCAREVDCSVGCDSPHTLNEQERTPIKLRTPPDTFDPISKDKQRTGYEFQARVEVTGYAHVRQLRIFCLPEPESTSRERFS